MERKVHILEVLDRTEQVWSPQIVGEVNDYAVKATNAAGGYCRHVHADTDEIFIVLSGRLHLDLDDRTVTLEPMEVYTVSAGVAHRPRAEAGTRLLFVEPRGTTQDGTAAGATGRRSE